jgi:hypothetical protein
VIEDFPLLVENAKVHPAGVQINSAVILMGFGVESHLLLLFEKCPQGAYLIGMLREESLMSIKMMKMG